MSPSKSRQGRPVARVSQGTPKRVRWTRRAERDLEEIYDYMARDDAAAAERWVESWPRGRQKSVMFP